MSADVSSEEAAQPASTSGDVFAFPASPEQERLLFIDGTQPGTPAYNECFAFRLRGALDVAALRSAVNEVVARHEALRTALDAPGGVPRQIVQPVVVLALDPESPREGESSEAWLTRRAGAPFDLERGPLVRTGLLRLGEDDHVFMLCAHHAICDGLSLEVALREVTLAYADLRAGRATSLPEVEVQYPDFAVWRREHLEGEGFERQLSYWRTRLTGVEQPLPLPSDRPRPAFQALRGGLVTSRLGADDLAAVDALARSRHTTRFTVLLAAYMALLARVAQVRDVAVGVPVANRDAEGTERAVGFYVNVLVYRSEVETAAPFTALLDTVRTAAEEALEHRDVPFDRVVDAVHPARSLAYNPLFQAMFSLADDPARSFRPEGLAIERLPVETGGARVDLWFNVMQGEHDALLQVEYDGALFDRATAERMTSWYGCLLREATRSPSSPLGSLALMSAEEHALVSARWPIADESLPAAPLLPQAFRARVASQPTAVAVRHVDGGADVTYAELEGRVAAVAGALAARGVMEGDTVVVLLERDAWLPAALMGVHRNRAAYVPIDVSLPPSRVRAMLEDAAPRGVVTCRALADRLPEPGCWVLQVEDLTPAVEAHAAVGEDEVREDDLAYVIFTSGSTGRPKGVEITHGALANFLGSMARQPGFEAHDRLLALTTVTFDIAGLELFLPLVTGGTVVMADRDTSRDAAALAAAIEAHRISVVQATPATWRLLLDAGWSGGASLRALVGGEALAPELATALVGRVGELWNVYGPTETTIWSTLHRVAPDDAYVSIGRPIANTVTYVVDEFDAPCPVGVPGEILIGGHGVARGYRGQPALTAERFVGDPVGTAGRVYRTGDRGRWRADGRLEHLGRRDDQVKVRGFRIELGDVEASLLRHPDVREAAAVVRTDPIGAHTLVGYVVPRAGATLTTTTLRRSAREQLPEYMVPSHFVVLDRLPLTPSGKVDRRGLPDPFGSSAAVRSRRPPRTATEQLVAGVWQQVTGGLEPGLDDNFFDAGGHSLGAMRVISLIAEATGRRLSPQVLIRETLEHVAAAADREPKG